MPTDPQLSSADSERLRGVLLEKVIPHVKTQGIAGVFCALPTSWEKLRKTEYPLPDGTAATYEPIKGKRVRVRSRRSYGNMSVEEYRWPEDKLISARVPKLCFVIHGHVAYQIADYVLHCHPHETVANRQLIDLQGIPRNCFQECSGKSQPRSHAHNLKNEQWLAARAAPPKLFRSAFLSPDSISGFFLRASRPAYTRYSGGVVSRRANPWRTTASARSQ